MQDLDDLENCPFIKDKLENLSEEQLKLMREQYEKHIKPQIQQKRAKQEESKIPKKNGDHKNIPPPPKKRERHPRLKAFQEAQGSCPFLNQSCVLI